MLEQWRHAHLYAVSPGPDPLAFAPEPYLAIETPTGWRFLYSPNLGSLGDGPHEIDDETLELAADYGFDLPPVDVLSLWSERDAAVLRIARAYGLLPDEQNPFAEANAIIRDATPEGRISAHLNHRPDWANSHLHVHTTRTGRFSSATIVLRTDNPYQLRAMLVLLGVNLQDIKALIDAP